MSGNETDMGDEIDAGVKGIVGAEVDDVRVDDSSPAVVDTPGGDLPASWTPAMRLAARIHATPFVPKALRGNPHSVLACILTGEEHGLGPMKSLEYIDVIDGRPTLKPVAMRALVNRAGHRLSVVESKQDRVTLHGRRADNGSEATVTWTMDDAKRAQLTANPAWTKYPRSMLLARATSELCRQIFPDVIGGLYAPEEWASVRGVSHLPDDDDLIDPVLSVAAVETSDDEPGPPVPDDRQNEERPHDPNLAKRIHAEVAVTFPGATPAERDRRRHALVAVVTRNRPDGPRWSSSDLDYAEQMELSLVLGRIQRGEVSLIEVDDVTLELRSADGRRRCFVHEDSRNVNLLLLTGDEET